MRVVDYTHAGGTRIQRHFDSSCCRIAFESHSSAHAQSCISFAYDCNRRLWIAEDVSYSFEGEQQTLLQLGCNEHLRRGLDEDIVLTQIRAKPLRIRDGWSSWKDELCFPHKSIAESTRRLSIATNSCFNSSIF